MTAKTARATQKRGAVFQSHVAMTAPAASGRKSVGRALRATTLRWKKNQASKNQTASAVTVAHAAPSIPKRGMNRKHSETFTVAEATAARKWRSCRCDAFK